MLINECFHSKYNKFEVELKTYFGARTMTRLRNSNIKYLVNFLISGYKQITNFDRNCGRNSELHEKRNIHTQF